MMKDVIKVWTTDTGIWIECSDDSRAFERFSDYPRLAKASAEERAAFELTPFGLRWEGLDEDLSFEGFFAKVDQHKD